jgi:hypothetical protein
MKIGKNSRVWLIILAAGLTSGIIGFVQAGWNIGDSIGLAVWLLLAAGVVTLIWRENHG